jgi:hypothetical protein
MHQHQFIFSPGIWLGEGTIRFNTAKETIKFYARWSVSEKENGAISIVQKVEMEGGGEQVVNQLEASEITPDKFSLRLENPMIGVVNGNGVIDDKTIAWEFLDNDKGFEGFEIFEVTDRGYQMRGEYCSADQARTMIEGAVWQRVEV